MKQLFFFFLLLGAFVQGRAQDPRALDSLPPQRHIPAKCDCYEGYFYALSPRMAYTHTKGRNSGFVGGTFHNDCIACGGGFYAGARFTGKDGRLKVLPEIGADFYLLLLGYGASLSTEAVTPRVGLTVLDFLRVDAGYAIPFVKDPIFKGLTLSVIVNIRFLGVPLRK